jgi:hypothetical protein
MFKLGRSIFFLSLALAASADANSAEGATLQVQIHDFAGLEPQTLQQFLSLTERILAGTGMSVQVSLCRGSIPVSCEDRTGSLDCLVVRIVAGYAKTQESLNRLALGLSFADQNGGAYATVFVRPAQDEAATANVPWVVVLAYAAAHEVGHLLLGARAHTSRGLMKAKWVPGDYMAMDQDRCHFTPEQARTLAKRYGADAPTP